MKVLVVRAGALGDLLLLRRALAALRRAGAHLTLLAPADPGSALLGGGPADVHRLIPWERASVAALLADGGAPAESVRAELGGFDVALVYSVNRDLARNLAALVPRVVAHPPSPAGGHASDWLARPLAELGLDAAGDPPACEPTPDERAACAALRAALPSAFLALHAGSGSPRKNWPPERFAVLAARASAGRPWLLVEGPAESAGAASLAGCPGAVRASGLSPRTLGALLAQAGAYAGNDSGVTHLAAAWGAPTLALFGPTQPAVWAPLGPRVRTLRSPTGRLDEISVDAALAALAHLLPPGHAPR